jgi:hypothetical protein
MAQECRGLAAAVPDADQRAYFLRMAGMAELAVRPREVD